MKICHNLSTSYLLKPRHLCLLEKLSPDKELFFPMYYANTSARRNCLFAVLKLPLCSWHKHWEKCQGDNFNCYYSSSNHYFLDQCALNLHICTIAQGIRCMAVLTANFAHTFVKLILRSLFSSLPNNLERRIWIRKISTTPESHDPGEPKTEGGNENAEDSRSRSRPKRNQSEEITTFGEVRT